MCGICGIIHSEPGRPIDGAALERMNEALLHRGPDEGGQWINANAGLAMRRLSVIDIAQGQQPMCMGNQGPVLVYNGEVYNYRELRANLEKEGVQFRTQSDTEVVLACLAKRGDAALTGFNGMYALALYDPDRDRLFLARDRMGIKPLYYTLRGGTLYFASELRALIQGIDGPMALDPEALHGYLSHLYVPGNMTIYEDVFALPPGHHATFEGGRLTIAPYWELPQEKESDWTLESAAEHFRELLDDSVRLRTVSDVPLGAFLSGGLDSSGVVAALAKTLSQPVKTFTVGFDDAQADEMPFAQMVADALGTDHHAEVLALDPVALLPDLVRHFGQPFADSSALPTWLVSRMARSEVTVALSGDGGDELFGGYTWTQRSCDVMRARRAPRSVRALLEFLLRAAPHSPAINRLRHFIADTMLSNREVFRRRTSCFEAGLLNQLYRPEWLERLDAQAETRLDALWKQAKGDDRDRMLYVDTLQYLPDDILTKVDRMSMAHSLEVRVPLLDHRMVEFAARLPFELKMRGGETKRVPRHAFRGLLPKAVLARGKRGFAVPIQHWFRNQLRAHSEAYLLDSSSRVCTVFDPCAIRAMLETHWNRQEDHGHRLWALLVLEHWLRYVERSASS